MAQKAVEIFRKYETDNIPSSGLNEPKKSAIRAWGTYLENVINAGVLSDAVWKRTEALLQADKAYDDGKLGIVFEDATDINNGLWLKNGASGFGNWEQLTSFLPGYQFVTAIDDDNSTANAYTFDTTPRLPSGDGVALVSFTVPETNTSDTVTISFDGRPSMTLKIASGSKPVVGGLVVGMPVVGVVSGSDFRMLSDQTSAAIQTAAANSANSAKAFAINAEDVPVSVLAGGNGLDEFSAFHWAKKAEGFAGGLSIPQPNNGTIGDQLRIGANGYELYTPLEAVDIRIETILDYYYTDGNGDPNWTQFSGIGLGSDCYAAIIDYRQNVNQAARINVKFPNGSWRLGIGATAAMCNGLTIEGESILGTQFNYDSTGGQIWVDTSAGGLTGSNFKRGTILLWADGADTNVVAFLLQGDATYQPGFTTIAELNITSPDGSYYFRAIQCIGNLRTSPQGQRVLRLRELSCFQSRTVAIFLSNVVDVWVGHVGVYTGKLSGNDMQVAGGGALDTNSTLIFAYGLNIGGILNLGDCKTSKFDGNFGSVFIAATATRCKVSGFCLAVTNLSATSTTDLI